MKPLNFFQNNYGLKSEGEVDETEEEEDGDDDDDDGDEEEEK